MTDNDSLFDDWKPWLTRVKEHLAMRRRIHKSGTIPASTIKSMPELIAKIERDSIAAEVLALQLGEGASAEALARVRNKLDALSGILCDASFEE